MRIVTWCCLALTLLLPASAQESSRIEVRVDPRIELLTTLARLAGFREYRMANADSAYSKRVEARFGSQAEHAAVKRVQALRAERGVSYDAIPSLAMHLGPLPELVERVPFDKAPERLDARWGGAQAREFLTELRDFARVTKAAEFFEAEREFYAEVERRLGARLAQSKALPWFDSFFGARAGARYLAIPGLLCGGGNYGVGVRFADGTPEEITPVFGCWSWDEQGVPVFDEGYLPLYIHELCHSYTNRFVDALGDELEAAGKKLHATCAEQMKRQGYGNWRTMMYESLVRASVVRCRAATEGPDAAKQQEREELSNHFAWVPKLAELFAEYESQRERYPEFTAFLPKVSKFFDDYAAALPAQPVAPPAAAANAPKLLSIVPANGAADVDPALTKLVISFDRPMRDKSWSLVGSREDLPEITGALSYDAARKVLTVPVKLAAGRTYSFSLNGERYQGFVSAEGVPLAPVAVRFTTAQAR